MFKRGFKSWCETVSAALRSELGLQPIDPMDPFKLAAHLDVVVWRFDEIPGIPADVVATLRADSDSWSAATVCVGIRSAVILNSEHSARRINSDLTHEMSHIVLAHTSARVDVSADGLLLLSTYDRAQEEEANWLAGCLLVPREPLVVARRKKLSVEEIAVRFGASSDMVNYRINVTGVDEQIRRTRRKIART
jgi:Zn-dependent peptidase ImmA (M78 family)